MSTQYHGSCLCGKVKLSVPFANTEFSACHCQTCCKECGSHLYYHLKGTQNYYIAAWIFDDIKELKFTAEVFIDKKPTCYAFANPTHKLTEADILAMAAGKA